jgi:YHS domain-containing protein
LPTLDVVTRFLAIAPLGLILCACKPNAGSTSPEPAAAASESLDGRTVVPNPEAKPGDVTVCPFSGRKFVVKADSPRLDHQGRSYVFCSEKARDAVAAEPDKYLADPTPAPAPAGTP